jgi:hypothetical protein
MTTHDYKPPMSLTALWRRWQEIEDLPEHDKKVHTELDALEERLVGDEAENTWDLLAKLQYLHIRTEVEWNDNSERLYQSIVDGYQKLVVKNRDAYSRLEDAIFAIRGAANCVLDAFMEAEEPANKVGTYLGERLLDHAADAEAAFGEIAHLRVREGEFERLVPPPKPQDAQRDLAKLVLAALGPRATVGEVESVRRTLSFMLGALPAPIQAPEAMNAVNPPDPIIGLMAERERLVSETNATKPSVIGEVAFDALVDAAGKRIAEIDEQIADIVTANPESLAAQVSLLDLLGGDEFGQGLDVHHGDDCSVRLSASIQRGIRQLSGQSAEGGAA